MEKIALVETLLASAPAGCRILVRPRSSGAVEIEKIPVPNTITLAEIAELEGVSERTVRRKYLDTNLLRRRGRVFLRADYQAVVTA